MMKQYLVASLCVLAAVVATMRVASAHCEVPCGIYTDQLRFEQMLEDHTTIAKAMVQIKELSSKKDPLSQNQLVRWITTKETHATNTQHTIAQYFLTQRIKPGTDDASNKTYVKQLIAAHRVLLAAMKCKQSVDAVNSDALKEAILDLYRAYEGKEPELH